MRPRAMLSMLLFVPLCGGIPANAQELKTADDVIAKYIEAIGGRKKLDSIMTRRMTGKTVAPGGLEIPIVIEQKRPNKVRSEFTVQGMVGIRGFDGETGWTIAPFMGKTEPEKMSPDELKIVKQDADFDSPLMDYKKKGHEIELIGKEEIEGTDAYKLKVTKKDGPVDYYYLDAEYFLPIKVKTKRELMGREIEIETSPGDYKEVDGLLISHSIEQAGFMGGTIMTFEKVEHNIDIPDDRFTMPTPDKQEGEKESKETPPAEKKEAKPAEEQKSAKPKETNP